MEAMPFLCTGVWFSSIIKPYNYKIGFIFAIINFFIFLNKFAKTRDEIISKLENDAIELWMFTQDVAFNTPKNF